MRVEKLKKLTTLAAFLSLANPVGAVLINIEGNSNDPLGPNQASYGIGIPIQNDDYQVAYNEAAVGHFNNIVVVGSNSIGYICDYYPDIEEVCLSQEQGVHIRILTSLDSGQTFTQNGLVELDLPNYPTNLYQQASDPFITVVDGVFYYTFVALSNRLIVPNGLDCSAPNEMLLTKSIDGINWTAPIQITPSGDNYLHDRPAISNDPSTGRLWAFWNGYVNDASGTCGGHQGEPFVQYSDNQGLTWSTPIPMRPINWGAADTAPVNLVSVNNRAYGAYFMGNDVWVMRVSDSGSRGVPIGQIPSNFLGTDHYFLNGIERTRLNSMIQMVRNPEGTQLLMTWTALNPDPTPEHETQIMVTTTIPGYTLGTRWRPPVALSKYSSAGQVYDYSGFIPIAAWSGGVGGTATVCYYQRIGSSDEIVMRCGQSQNGGITWKPYTYSINGETPFIVPRYPSNGNNCPMKQSFLGDYNTWDGLYLAVTTILPPLSGAPVCAYRPIVEVLYHPSTYRGISCAVIDPTSVPRGWFLLILIIPLLAIRRFNTK